MRTGASTSNYATWPLLRCLGGRARERAHMEVSALKPTALPALRGTSALLRLQPDERLIAMIRRGQHAAFETLFARYQPRLLAFCRHMLGSKEDAEDVLQEVFTAAFNAILADEREINVRPWLYRIARNRSLNHLRRVSAIGVDSMDIHYAEGGISTGEKVMRRESFRQLIADVQQLPETQRTALLLREIDALSYDQIAEAMETTIPSVKSLLVRARISLAEAAEARQLTCDQVREELGESAEGLRKLSAPARRHMRACERCRWFRRQLKSNNVALAAVMPVGAALLLRKLLASKLGAGASHVAGSAGAGAGASAAAGGTSAAGGLATAGVGTIATKAVAGLAAAALVTAGAVAAGHSGNHRHNQPLVAAPPPAAPPAAATTAPVVVRALPQPATSQHSPVISGHKESHHLTQPSTDPAASLQTATSTSITTTSSLTSSTLTSETETATTRGEPGATPPTEVVTETTQLPGSETSTSTTTTTTTTTSASATTASSSTAPDAAITPEQVGGTAAPAPAPGEGGEGG